MSIINEALKKAGQPIITEIQEAPKKRRANWGPFFVLSVLVVITMPILSPLLHNPYRNEGAPRQTAVGPDLSHPNLKKQFAMEQAPLPVMAPGTSPRFAMSGLVYSSGGSFCLINGKVVQEGETVNGAKLVKVTADAATLEYHGQQITLPANA